MNNFPNLSFLLVAFITIGLITESEADLLSKELGSKIVPPNWRMIKESIEDVLGRKLI